MAELRVVRTRKAKAVDHLAEETTVEAVGTGEDWLQDSIEEIVGRIDRMNGELRDLERHFTSHENKAGEFNKKFPEMMGRKVDEAQITALHERIDQVNGGLERVLTQQKQMESRWTENFQKMEDQFEAKTNKLQVQVTANATLAERTVKEALDTLNVELAISDRAQSQKAMVTETIRENLISVTKAF